MGVEATGSVTVEAQWCMGHRLPNHRDLCYNLHGHQYRAEVTVIGNISSQRGSPSEGMVVDFTDVKTRLKELVGDLDHRTLIYVGDPFADALRQMPGITLVEYIPTAENIAWTLLSALRPQNVSSVRVWETPTSYATVWR